MKRILARVFLGVVTIAAAGIALVALRPDLIPAWARLREPEHAVHKDPPGSNEAPEPLTALIDGKDDGWCAEHNRPEATCEQCAKEPTKDAKDCKPLPMIRLASASTAQEIGLQKAKAVSLRHADHIAGNAEIDYVGHDYAHVRPRVSGRIIAIPADEGETVQRGQALVIVDSAEVGSAKAAYLSALPVYEAARKTLDRIEELVKAKAIALKDEIDARAAYNKANADLLNARQKLLNFGFSETELKEIAGKKETSSVLKILAPIGGTLVERHAVFGEAVEPTSQLFEVADLSMMWAWIDVYEADVTDVKIGHKVTFISSGANPRTYTGVVDLIDFHVNEVTRTIRVRADIANTDRQLRAKQFGFARIQVSDEHDGTFVPKEAVQRIGRTDLVFIPESDGRTFRPQRVAAKATDLAGQVEIEWGVKPGQTVVTTGSFLLKSELLKADLGDACCQ